MTCIEDLSTELFYQIFDNLDDCEIFLAFSNLNYCFHQLLNSPSLLFKINFNSKSNRSYIDIFEDMVNFNQHQLFSIHLFDTYERIFHWSSIHVSWFDDRTIRRNDFQWVPIDRLYHRTCRWRIFLAMEIMLGDVI